MVTTARQVLISFHTSKFMIKMYKMFGNYVMKYNTKWINGQEKSGLL
jgi:hypothetical protein